MSSSAGMARQRAVEVALAGKLHQRGCVDDQRAVGTKIRLYEAEPLEPVWQPGRLRRLVHAGDLDDNVGRRSGGERVDGKAVARPYAKRVSGSRRERCLNACRGRCGPGPPVQPPDALGLVVGDEARVLVGGAGRLRP